MSGDPTATPSRRATESSAAREGADPDQELASVEAAIAALEAQRAVLGDDVVATALGPLRQRREELRTPRSHSRLTLRRANVKLQKDYCWNSCRHYGYRSHVA